MRVKMCCSLPQGTRHTLCRIQNKFGIVAKHVEFSDTISSAICKQHPFVCIKPARNMAPAANEPQASTTHSRVRLKHVPMTQWISTWSSLFSPITFDAPWRQLTHRFMQLCSHSSTRIKDLGSPRTWTICCIPTTTQFVSNLEPHSWKIIGCRPTHFLDWFEKRIEKERVRDRWTITSHQFNSFIQIKQIGICFFTQAAV